MEPKNRRCIFSIGHSNHTLERFLSLLKEHKIEVLVDTRSHPHSKHVPYFSADGIQEAVTGAGIQYLFLGKELGGRPEEPEFYDSEGHVLYWRLADSAKFEEGIRCLEEKIRAHRVAIMCSEEDPFSCHRRLLVGYVLTRRGIVLEHIRGNGRVEQEEKVTTGDEQGSLFEEQGKHRWKSTQSVLQRGRQPNSSEH